MVNAVVRLVLADGSISSNVYTVLSKTTDAKERVELRSDNGINIKAHYQRIVSSEQGIHRDGKPQTGESQEFSVNPVTNEEELEIMSVQVEEQTPAGASVKPAKAPKAAKPPKPEKPPKKTKDEIIASISLFDFNTLKVKGLDVYVSDAKPWGAYTMQTVALFVPDGKRQQIFNLYNGRLSLSNPDASIHLNALMTGTVPSGMKQLWKVNEKFSEEKLLKSGYKKLN